MRDTVLLMSGGLDSGLLLLDEWDRLVCGLFVNYDQPAAWQEQRAAFAQATSRTVGLLTMRASIPFSVGDDHEHGDGTIVPGRNALLLSLAVSCALQRGAERVIFGANADDAAVYWDCRPDFIGAFDAMARSTYGVTVSAPLVEVGKREIAARAGDRLAAVWSCYRAGEKPCGECASCRDLD